MAAQVCRKLPSRHLDGWHLLLAALALLLALLASGHVLAQAAGQSSVRARLDSARSELTQIEAALANPATSDAELQRQRLLLQPLRTQLQQIVEEQLPRVEQAKQRLDQLGAKPDAKAPAESADVAAEREAREKAFAEADDTLKIARAALLQNDQLQTEISDRRREIFAKELFAAGSSILNPDLWHSALSALPDDMHASGQLLGDWLSVVGGTLLDERGLLLGLAFLGAILLYVARARYLPRFKARYAGDTDTDGLHCLRIALAHVVAGAAPPALASWLIYRALSTAGLLPPRIQPVIWAVVTGLALFAFVQALVDALFAPGNPQRRLASVMDSTARIVVRMACSLAIVLAVGKVFEAWLQAIAAGLPISIIVRGAVSIAFALTLIVALYQLRDDEEVEEEANLGPYVPVDGTSLGAIRILGWVVGLTIAAAALAGYGVFASFLSEQVIWLGILACLFVLAFQLADLGTTELLTGKGRLALTLKAGIGIRSTTLQKIAVIVTGLLKIVLIAATLMLALAPWGLESSDFLSSLRAAFFGFQVGGVTISLSSIILAGLLFALGLAATRAFQRWLDGKFLPTTRLDTGLRNSITTAAGYLGFAGAVAFAVSSLGLSLERLTLVASALSVGIGFGLQSVVSNFVSGLILLWERPIRVGDQVLIGDAEGIVKRINVRSTEIATFDRSVVVVPNSNLITGVVRNRVRSDRTGRVLISISVPRTLDPTKVRAMLEDAATAHGDVMQKPGPTILFKKLGTATMDFDLICVVEEVDIVGRVTSDLNYVIHKRLAEMEEAPPPPELLVHGLDGVEQSLSDIAAAVSRGAKPPRRAKPTAPARKSGARPVQDEPAEEAEPESAPAPAPEPAKDDSKE